MDTISPIFHKILSRHFSADDIVIIAPLNWGLGHATRCIPVIHYLNSICKQVIIASDGASLALLKKEFPDMNFEELPSYHIRYVFKSIIINILLMMPSIIRAVLAERKSATKIVKNYHATIILSDNRFGFRYPAVKNIYMTHQINILHNQPMISFLGSKMHQWFIKKFDICLVPDYSDKKSLCPALTQGNNIEKIFIGPLTRMKKLELPLKWDICVMLSGPEPQRSILEKELIKQLIVLKRYKILFVTGKEKVYEDLHLPKHISTRSLLTSSEVEEILNSSKLLISRSGYSTIMDIENLDIHAIFIPTPGQTEQEYLGQTLTINDKYNNLHQDKIGQLAGIIEKQFAKINYSPK
jgi:Glycosyltransferase family 28 C-terminal domain